MKILVLVPALVLGTAATCMAQATRPAVEHAQTISTAPIADLLGFINAEYQRKITPAATAGLSAGTLEFDEDRYTNVMLLGRYYPQGAALTGFFIGGRAGVHRVSYETYFYGPDDPVPVIEREASLHPAIGLDIGYDWLLGSKRNVMIGVGAGGMRLFGDDSGLGIQAAFPTARLNVGLAF